MKYRLDRARKPNKMWMSILGPIVCYLQTNMPKGTPIAEVWKEAKHRASKVYQNAKTGERNKMQKGTIKPEEVIKAFRDQWNAEHPAPPA
jgi:hypothetical protein